MQPLVFHSEFTSGCRRNTYFLGKRVCMWGGGGRGAGKEGGW